MIGLGSVDPGTSDAAWEAYIGRVSAMTGHSVSRDRLRGEGLGVYVAPKPVADDEMTVAEVQRFLKDADFVATGDAEGICGYRTTSGIRLFQEHVRTVEKDASIGAPDGVLGPNGFKAVERWRREGRKADWSPGAGGDRYGRGLELLKEIKAHCLAHPSPMLAKVAEYFTDAGARADTLRTTEWDFGAEHVHLIGVRESSPATAKKLNDVFFLLIKGMVFTFFGSTDPGSAHGEGERLGAPFLATGQHLYRFGWHKLSVEDRVYQALKPLEHGVLVARSPGDLVLSAADIAAGLTVNGSINIHWGGSGFSGSAGWSAGCQVIAGRKYVNHKDEPVDMGRYAASKYGELGFDPATRKFRNKGAYTVFGDLVTAFSGDDNTVHYTLLTEEELAVSPGVVEMLNQARARF